MYAQVQLLYEPAADKFFVADQVFVKWGIDPSTNKEVIVDLLVIENKLQGTTALTTNQLAGRRAGSLNVRSIGQGVASPAVNRAAGTAAPALDQTRVGLAPSHWFKIFDSESGDVISGVVNVP